MGKATGQKEKATRSRWAEVPGGDGMISTLVPIDAPASFRYFPNNHFGVGNAI